MHVYRLTLEARYMQSVISPKYMSPSFLTLRNEPLSVIYNSGSNSGKELSPWLFTCAVSFFLFFFSFFSFFFFIYIYILVPSYLWVSLSSLVFRAGCGIRLYRFLIIAFVSTLTFSVVIHWFIWRTSVWFWMVGCVGVLRPFDTF